MSDTKLIVTKDKLDKLATSISTKSGVATPMTIAQMKAAVDGIAGGTITQDEDGYLVISENGNQGDTVNIELLLSGEAPVGVLNLPNTTEIKDNAFINCKHITSVNAPNVTRIGSYAFKNCTALENVNFPSLKAIGKINNNLYTTDDTAIGNNTESLAFCWCNNLKNVFLPKVTHVGHQSFYQINFSAKAGEYNTIIVMPSAVILGNLIFKQGKFKAIDLGVNLNKLWGDAFYSSTIDAVILRSPMVVTAATRDAVRNITTLYVPSALVSEYSTATNWATDAASRTILPIEGSIYETQYADGTPITGSIVDIDLSQCNWESNNTYSESSNIGTSYDDMTDNGSGNRIISGLIDVSDTSEICVIAKDGYQYGYIGFDENGNYLKKYLNWSSAPFYIDIANNEIKKIAIIIRLGNGSTAVAPGSWADTGITVRRQWM